MEHTFLLRKGAWTGKGVYFDERRIFTPLISHVEITHLRDLWMNVGWMRLYLDEVVTIKSTYEITPFPPDSDTTTWRSFHPELGILNGRFVVIDDTIISTFRSASGEYSGTEHLLLVTEAHYKCRGVSFLAGERLSSWSLELRRDAV